MKKILALILSLCFLISGCGQDSGPATPETFPETAAPENTKAPSETKETTAATVESQDSSLNFTETTLVDNDSLLFSVKSAQQASDGLSLSVLCENRTNRDLIFSWDTVSVCGILSTSNWSLEVGAGMAVEGPVFLPATPGIPVPKEIAFRLLVLDPESWMEEPVESGFYSIYPTGLSPDTVIFPERVSLPDETILADTDNLALVALETRDREDFYSIRCFLENRSQDSLILSLDGVTVDGSPVDPMWSMELPSSLGAYSEVCFNRTDLGEFGIKDPKVFAFTLTATDPEGTLLEELSLTFEP